MRLGNVKDTEIVVFPNPSKTVKFDQNMIRIPTFKAVDTHIGSLTRRCTIQLTN
jgi:hypothetical protein